MKDDDAVTCEQPWEALRWDPLPWLLDDCGPGVRWRVLCELVGRPLESPAAVRARGGASAAEPVASLLARLRPDGSWETTSSTWSRYRGVGWRLVAAIQWGADISDPRLRAAAGHLLRIAGGEGGLEPTACITARGLQALAELGQARDPRFEEALAWLEATAGLVGGRGWSCPFVGHRGPGGGCAVTAVAVLGTLFAAPDHRRPALHDRAVAELDQVLSAGGRPQGLHRYGHPNLMRTDAAEILQVLARSAAPFREAWLPSLRRLQAGQDDRGRWSLGTALPASLGIIGESEPGHPSPWVTLRAATAVMHYAVEARLPRLFPSKPSEPAPDLSR